MTQLDFNGIKTKAELHKYLAKTLELPAHYGNNLDALEDVLSERKSIKIKVKGVAALRKAMPEYADNLLNVLNNFK